MDAAALAREKESTNKLSVGLTWSSRTAVRYGSVIESEPEPSVTEPTRPLRRTPLRARERGDSESVARAEKAAARARTPKGYAGALADSVVGADGLILSVEALILTRQRPALVPEIARTIERPHAEGARAYAGEIARHGWHTHHAHKTTAPNTPTRARA